MASDSDETPEQAEITPRMPAPADTEPDDVLGYESADPSLLDRLWHEHRSDPAKLPPVG